MLPPFQDGMYLPVGDHPATWDDIVDRFGGNRRRQGFCNRLRTFLDRAKGCEFIKVYVFGSFISAKDDPGDVDLLWIYRQNLDLDTLSRDCKELLDYGLNRAREGWDMWCCSNDEVTINYLMEGWRRDKSSEKKPRGVILIDLAAL
jgi:hypothetical protein